MIQQAFCIAAAVGDNAKAQAMTQVGGFYSFRKMFVYSDQHPVDLIAFFTLLVMSTWSWHYISTATRAVLLALKR